MEVTVAYKNADALAGFEPAWERWERANDLLHREIRLALGTISQALEDGLEDLDDLPSDLDINEETVAKALRLSYSHTDYLLQRTSDKVVLVVAKTSERGYLVLVPTKHWKGGALVVHGRVSESKRAWTITQTGLSGRPLP